ncbi:MAG: hypothetical protein M3076_08500 [Actinomycetota bacterium]|nr:hypothetical protein [Actinomycetota bacterium]
MTLDAVRQDLRDELRLLESGDLLKGERVFDSPQAAHVRLAGGRTVLNLCSNNYLGLAAVDGRCERGLSGLGCARVFYV